MQVRSFPRTNEGWFILSLTSVTCMCIGIIASSSSKAYCDPQGHWRNQTLRLHFQAVSSCSPNTPRLRNCDPANAGIGQSACITFSQEFKDCHWAAHVTCNCFLQWEEQGGHSHPNNTAFPVLSWKRNRRILRSKAAIFSSILLSPFIACLRETNKVWWVSVGNSLANLGYFSWKCWM